MNANIIQQMVCKLGIQDNPNLIEKSTELLRLLELKSSSSKFVSSIGIYGKTVICIDLAAELFSVMIDTDDLLKLSGLKKTSYLQYKKVISKLLDISKSLDIKDICTQLNINEMINKSTELYELFIKYHPNIDITNTQYKVMAIYQTCKLLKKKLPKSSIIKYSNLKLTQWNKLEEQWDKFIESLSSKTAAVQKLDKTNCNSENNIEMNSNKTKQIEGNQENNIEDYEIWKRRMITFAKLELGLLNAGLSD